MFCVNYLGLGRRTDSPATDCVYSANIEFLYFLDYRQELSVPESSIPVEFWDMIVTEQSVYNCIMFIHVNRMQWVMINSTSLALKKIFTIIFQDTNSVYLSWHKIISVTLLIPRPKILEQLNFILEQAPLENIYLGIYFEINKRRCFIWRRSLTNDYEN